MSPQDNFTKVLHRLKVLVLMLVVLTLVLGAVHFRKSGLFAVAKVLTGRTGGDSVSCMGPAWAALREGKPVYETIFFSRVAKFQYPMSSLLIFSFGELFGIHGEMSIKILALVSVPLTLLLCGEIFLLMLPTEWKPGTRSLLQIRACIALLGLLFFPLATAASYGQLQMFLAFLWTLAVYFWIRDRQELSGLCIALVCLVKPQFIVFLVWALLRRRWRFLFPMLALTSATQLLTIFLFGWHNEVEYLKVVSYLSHHGEVYYPNQSVNGLLQRLLKTADTLTWDGGGFPAYNATVYFGTVVSSILFLATGLLLPVLRRWRDSNLDFFFFALVTTVASPIAWEHHYSYFFPVIVYMMALFYVRSLALPTGFQVSFLMLSIALPVLLPLAHSEWSILLSYEFFAGLYILMSLVLLAEITPAQPTEILGLTHKLDLSAVSTTESAVRSA